MGELKNEDEGVEHALPTKRKPAELVQVNDVKEIESTKKQKSKVVVENNSPVAHHHKLIQPEDDDEDEEEEYEEDDEDDEDDSNGDEAKIDHKGKGVMKDDKGKGKLIEESDNDDDDDSGDGDGSDDDSDSDLSDDPLLEVDLDNILPSRTRRGASRPGLFIARDCDSKHNNN